MMSVPTTLITFFLGVVLALIAVVYKLFSTGIQKDLEIFGSKIKEEIKDDIKNDFDDLKKDMEKKHQHLINNIKHIDELAKLTER